MLMKANQQKGSDGSTVVSLDGMDSDSVHSTTSSPEPYPSPTPSTHSCPRPIPTGTYLVCVINYQVL